MPIVLKKKGRKAKKITNIPFSKESELQKYIRDNPETIPLDDIREDMRLLVLTREFSTTAGKADALAVDDEGSIYIIETKLYKNPDKRYVVAQALDYGAGIWARYPGYDEFERALENAVSKEHKKALRVKLSESFEIDESGVEELLESMKENFRSGRFTFIVLMDELHDKLKNLIAFINANSQFNLLGCELELYREDDIEILIPKLYGVEIKPPSASDGRGFWDEASFFEAVNKLDDENVKEKIRKMYEFFYKTADEIAWSSRSKGSFSPKYYKINRRSFFTLFSDGSLRISFGFMHGDEGSAEFRKKLKEELEAKTRLKFGEDYEAKYPRFQAGEWIDSADEIIEIIKHLVIRRA